MKILRSKNSYPRIHIDEVYKKVPTSKIWRSRIPILFLKYSIPKQNPYLNDKRNKNNDLFKSFTITRVKLSRLSQKTYLYLILSGRLATLPARRGVRWLLIRGVNGTRGIWNVLNGTGFGYEGIGGLRICYRPAVGRPYARDTSGVRAVFAASMTSFDGTGLNN